jgi:hypothetical protein
VDSTGALRRSQRESHAVAGLEQRAGPDLPRWDPPAKELEPCESKARLRWPPVAVDPGPVPVRAAASGALLHSPPEAFQGCGLDRSSASLSLARPSRR